MKIRNISIKNFRSIYELKTELEGLVVLMGTNNSGKTTFLLAIKLIFRNIDKFKEQTIIEEYAHNLGIDEIDNLWFFENSSESAIVSVTLYIEPEEVKDIIEISGLKEVKGANLEVILEKVEENKVRLKLNKLSLLGYVTISSKKVDEILKSQSIDLKENYTESKIVENSRISDSSLFKKVLPIFIGKVHYINMYENVPREEYRINGLKSHILPRDLHEDLENIVKNKRKYRRFLGYSKMITGSKYTPSLEKEQEGSYLKYYFFGGGDQTIDSLLARILNKGQNHIFLLEEPELHLHPSYIKRFGKLLEELVRKERVQIIITSNSPFLIKYLEDIEKSLYIVKRTYTGTPLGKLPSTKILRLLDISGKEFPQLFIKTELFFSEALFLVEGTNDQIIIEKCIEILRNQLNNLPNLHIGYIQYAEKDLEEVLELANIIGQLMDIPQVIIADGDKRGEDYIKQALKKDFKEGRNAFRLKHEDIFLAIREEILKEAIVKTLEKLKNKIDEKIIKDKLQNIKEIKSKNDLESIFSDLEEVPRWRIYLAKTIAEKINKPEDLKEDIVYILRNIDTYLNEYLKGIRLEI